MMITDHEAAFLGLILVAICCIHSVNCEIADIEFYLFEQLSSTLMMNENVTLTG